MILLIVVCGVMIASRSAHDGTSKRFIFLRRCRNERAIDHVIRLDNHSQQSDFSYGCFDELKRKAKEPVTTTKAEGFQFVRHITHRTKQRQL